MTYIEFCYWLQGFFELANPQTLTSEQIQVVKNHLDMTKVLATPGVELPSPYKDHRWSADGSTLLKC